jgi:DNA polymerase-3 subunit alpha
VERGEVLGLRVYLEQAPAVLHVKGLLERAAEEATARSRATVSLCMMMPDGAEIDVDLGETFPVTPQIRSALKSLPGVVSVEDA